MKITYKQVDTSKLNDLQKAQIEKKQLEKWFTDYYTIHEQKYNRLIAIDKLNDDGTNPNDTLIDLYNEAESKRTRIQAIESMADSAIEVSEVIDNEQ